MSGLPMGASPSQPIMQGNGFQWYGGSPLIPEGGTYNQMAQDMAGPSYAPPGSNYYSSPGAAKGAKGASPGMGAKGASPGMGAKGASPSGIKGALPYGGASTGGPRAGVGPNLPMRPRLMLR